MKFFTQRITPAPSTTGGEGADLSALASPAFVSTVVATRPDVLSFDQVYDTHFDFVWRYARNRGVPPSALDDVVQEVFIVVHRKLATFEGRSSVRTWLAMITRRAFCLRAEMAAASAVAPVARPSSTRSTALPLSSGSSDE